MTLNEWYNIKLITILIDVFGFVGCLIKCHRSHIFAKKFVFFLILATLFLAALTADVDIIKGKYASILFEEPIKSLTIKGILTCAIWYVVFSKGEW